MPFLSFNHARDATAFAIVDGGEYDGEVLYIHPETQTPDMRAAEGNPHEVRLDASGEFLPLPNVDPKGRDLWYVTGAAGCGKSRMAGKIAAEYCRMWPDRAIYLISKIDEDPLLDCIPTLKRIDPETLITIPIDWHEFANSLLIIDDYDTFRPDILAACRHIINEVSTLGRHEVISMLVISHKITDGLHSRVYLSEAQNYIVYPTGASAQQLKYLLENHAGCEPKLAGRMRRLGRWAMIRKIWPQCLLSKGFAALLNCDIEDDGPEDYGGFAEFTGGPKQ